jgi:hypothetical protein
VSVPRDRLGRVLPGHSLNPAGRARDSLGAAIREATKGGVELATLALGIARNVELPPGDRLRALEFLADRAYGKAIALVQTDSTIRVADPRIINVEALSAEQLDVIGAIEERHLAALPEGAAGDAVEAEFSPAAEPVPNSKPTGIAAAIQAAIGRGSAK